MTDSPQSVVRRFLAAWEGWPNVDDIASFFADDAVFIDGPRGVHRGIAAIRSELEAEAAMGFRNLRADISSLVADGGTVMLERVDNFTIGGKPFSMEVMAAFEIGDGRIKRWRESYDLKSITDQIEAAGFSAPA
jgi:limonene-1,2-epoxide hydrolase